MADKLSAGRGCLLGLAVGDAMGIAVDKKSLAEIYEDYGPNGLLGYDLTNGNAEVSSYTQIAAFTGNGILLGIARGKQDLLPYITVALREWARNQNFHRDPEASRCWVAKPKCLRQHNNRDARLLDALRPQTLGSPDAPVNSNATPGVLAQAIPLAMYAHGHGLSDYELATLAVRTAALTHGYAEAFLSVAVLAVCLSRILSQPDQPVHERIRQAVKAVGEQYGAAFPVAIGQLQARIERAITMALDDKFEIRVEMERLCCSTAAQCLAGSVYACMTSHDDFDTALITAVNHSGASAAVGAVTGAIMGAKLGADVLPEFYLESLVCAPELEVLSCDLLQSRVTTGLFDDAWDHKYIQGLPPE